MRFEYIDFDQMILSVEKFIWNYVDDDVEDDFAYGIEDIYASGLLYNIAAVIPPLMERSLSVLGRRKEDSIAEWERQTIGTKPLKQLLVGEER